MAKITPKENYLRLGRGEDPAYVPRFTMMGDEYSCWALRSLRG